MHGVLTAKTAVLVHLQPVRRVLLVLLRVVVALLALTKPPSSVACAIFHNKYVVFEATKINLCADR